jgi:ubiquinone/menaquinone biosynthesis C-methylase UbiE
MKTKKLNLGCGHDIKPTEEGWVNVDWLKLPGVDINFDLTKTPWPFEDNTFDEVYSRGTLMLLPDLIGNMQEIGRISKNGAKLTSIEACFPCFTSMQDPLVKTLFCWNKMNYFDGENEYYTPKGYHFKLIKQRFIYSPNKKLAWISFFVNLFPKFYARFLFNIFPSHWIHFELEVVK